MAVWDELVKDLDVRAIAARILAECTTFDVVALRADPFGALTRSREIRLTLESSLVDTGCGGGGYYRSAPPTIHLHPATARRDNFTLLHELGHHLQQTHIPWGYALLDMTDSRAALKIEEAVCDQVAAQVLLPVGETDRQDASLHPADVMAGLFARSEASRSATLMSVLEMLPRGSRWILAIADIEGRVQFSKTTYDDAPPRQEMVQEGFRRVAAEARDGSVRREFHEGIEYWSGSVLDGMRVEAALDYEGRYVFVALTPATANRQGTLTFRDRDCGNPACETTFQAQRSSGRCEKCEDFKCPDCHHCACEATVRPERCDACFMELTVAEVASGDHECWH